MMKRTTSISPVLLALIAVAAFGQDEEVIVDFATGVDPNLVKTEHFTWRIERRGNAAGLRLDRQPGQEWAHFYIQPARGHWDLSAYQYVVLDVVNLGGGRTACAARMENDEPTDARGWRRRFGRIAPDESIRLMIDIAPATLHDVSAREIRLIGMRSLPCGKPRDADVPFDASRIARIHFYTYATRWPRSFLLTSIRGGRRSQWEPPTAGSFFPCVDAFGQYVHRGWPGKTHSVKELTQRVEAEAVHLANHPRPSDWNQYGGWNDGPRLEATGRFRVQKHGDKWWLVDPDGRLFFSHGVAAVRIAGEFTPIDKRRHYFADLPEDDDPTFGPFYRRLKSTQPCFGSKPVLCYGFTDANLRLKYGPDWQTHFAELCHDRLASWGHNTFGNWTTPAIFEKRRTPYTVAGRIPGCRYLSGKAEGKGFIDVFSPRFDEALEKLTQQVAETADDPWCIGYFVHNELNWSNRVISRATLASRPDQPAKVEFVRMLRETFGSIEALDKEWHTRHPSWAALLASREPPDPKYAAAEMDAFERHVAERYFAAVRAAVKKGCASTLYLGCRFNTFNKAPAEIASRYCDIVSYNLYRTPEQAATFVFPGGADVPLIIGEWHFGALDRGQCDYGMCQVASQRERGANYVAYMESVLTHRQFVGAHWFRYKDQSFTGRHSDGANAQNGLLDICDTPYTETIAACRTVGRRLYELRSSAPRK